ncbi:MAG: NUDIX domain-containing protein [Candidatus Nanopelagicaceae bacterium]|nr:NUDIX domain-containing protein [Candidatus Nanopelagicaceae bacterium]
MNIDPRIRHTARVLLVDESDRLLLFQGQDPANPSDIYWCPVGGGIDVGESPEEAARREVREETGLIDFELGPHIWNRQHKYTFNGKRHHVNEKWFFARVSAFEVDTSALFGLERVAFLGHRWWAQSALDTTSEIMTPRQLASLYRDLTLNGLPEAPIELGIE